MCFISRQAHRTVNSNSGLAWGYAQPEVEKDHRKKKWQAWEESPLSCPLSIFLVSFCMSPYICVGLCLWIFLYFTSACRFSLCFSSFCICLSFSISLSYSLFYFQLWFACKFFLALCLSVSLSVCFSHIVSAALPLLLLPSICSLSSSLCFCFC